jgi:serine phosphatase RsbU (regulator of sigma subunit)
MATRSDASSETANAVSAAALRRLAQTVTRVAESASVDDRLRAIVEAAASELGAHVGVARVLDRETGELVARVAASDSAALAAELEGSRLAQEDLEQAVVTDPVRLPAAVARAARRGSAQAVFLAPVNVAGRTLGSVEFFRTGPEFSDAERQLALLAAGHVGLVLGADEAAAVARSGSANGALELAGDALTVGADPTRVRQTIVRLAAEATGAEVATLWRFQDRQLTLEVQSPSESLASDEAFQHAEEAIEAPRPFALARAGSSVDVSLRLGEPPLGVLQLRFDQTAEPDGRELARMTTFAVRVANALRVSDDAARLATDLERAQALLSVVDEAIAHLSLAHTLETAVDRVSNLASCDRVGVYLLENGRLELAAGRGLEGDHLRVAERLLELALGPFRARGMVVVDDAAWDLRLSSVRDSAAGAGIEAAVAVPLIVHEELIGVLAAYLARGQSLTESETGLLAALAVQLGVLVQNARLHETTKTLGEEREQLLGAERSSARQLRALSEISGSFAESLDFDTTLRALARTAVEALDVDVAVVRVPDERGELLVTQAFEAADNRLAVPLEPVLSYPARVASLPADGRRPIWMDAALAAELGPGYDVLVPFLERGSTAAIVPIAGPQELLATLTLVSLDQERPISSTALETALPLAAQAALALDKARLSQQQRQFFDTMQRSLLPASVPDVPGLEIGHLYEASARLEIGGDVYDLMTLPDGRLAAVIGDVSGHGIEAAGDMAMMKYLFRSLAREHSRPGDFLAQANEVVTGEIAAGKFVTMAYLIIDLARGVLACAAAGHPSPRLVRSDGTVTALPAGGLALGVEGSQVYDDVEELFPPGAAVVLYTDGVLEARRAGELYGEERLDALLARHSDLPADGLARAILNDCREFASGELDDDAAVVVLKHAP